MQERAVEMIICGVCNMCNDSIDAGNKPMTKRCMSFADVVVRYGSLPLLSVDPFVSMLCRTVNVESHGSWKIMRNLLSGNLGYTCRQAMLDMLEDAPRRVLAVDADQQIQWFGELADQIGGNFAARSAEALLELTGA